MNEFGQRAFQFFVSRGYTPAQAAALAGNAMVESGGRTTAVGDQGRAVGVFQWHPDRQANLRSFASRHGLDPSAETTQLQFKDWELQNTERAAGGRLRAAQTPQEANDAVLASLRPAGFRSNDPTGSMHYDRRLSNTLALAKEDPMPGYRPPLDFNSGSMARAQGTQGAYGAMQPPAGASFLGVNVPRPSLLNAPAPTGGSGSMAPYAPSTPMRDPSLDEMQVGDATAAATTPAAATDFGKVAAGLKGLADTMKPAPQPDIPMGQPMVNKPQAQELPQFASNQLLLQLARARAGGQRPMSPMAGLLGG